MYSTKKKKVTITLTEEAIEWLQSQRKAIHATSMSDVIERMARAKPDQAIAKTKDGAYILK